MSTQQAISVSQLYKTYSSYKKEPGFTGAIKGLFARETISVEAVAGISFSIEPGELVGFLGPNGAGKTTTLKILSGILTPTKGDVSVLGYNPTKRQPEFQKQIGIIMGQKNQLWWDLPASDSFELNQSIYQIPSAQLEKRKNKLVKILKVESLLDIPIRKLSLGERMKMELVGALLHGPQVLFLDEPTIGLDVVAQEEVRSFIKTYNSEFNATIMLTSHYMQDVASLCSRVIIINEGVMVYDGPLAELVKKFSQIKYVTVQLSDPSVAIPKKLGRVHKINEHTFRFEFAHDTVKDNVSILLGSLPVSDLVIEDVALDEVIRTMFTRK